MKTINIALDFTKYPGGRYKKNGKGSGEEFRNEFLLPELKSDQAVKVVLDGTSGYSSSFLEEAFGGLVRMGFSAQTIKALISIEASSKYEPYKQMIWQYVDGAKPTT